MIATPPRIRLSGSVGRLDRSALLVALLAILMAAATGLATVKLGSLQHQLKALIIVIAGVAMVVAALRPDYGLIILIALIPFEFGFFGTNSDQVLLYALALTMVWRIRASAIPSWVADRRAGARAGELHRRDRRPRSKRRTRRRRGLARRDRHPVRGVDGAA